MKSKLFICSIFLLSIILELFVAVITTVNYSFDVTDVKLVDTINKKNFMIDIFVNYYGEEYTYNIIVDDLYRQLIKVYNGDIYYADYSNNSLSYYGKTLNYQFLNSLDIIKLMNDSPSVELGPNYYQYVISYDKYNNFIGENPVNFTANNNFKYVDVVDDFYVYLKTNNNLIESIRFNLTEGVTFLMKYSKYGDNTISIDNSDKEVYIKNNINNMNKFNFFYSKKGDI